MAGYTVSSVTSGKYARQVTVAASGPQGAAGPKGDAGTPGGLSAQYRFLNSYLNENPGNGYLAFNDASIFSATSLLISETDMLSDSQAGLLDAAITSTNSYKAVITVQDASSVRKFSRYYVLEQSQSTGWRNLSIAYIDGTARSWAYNDRLVISVTPIGDAGPNGAGVPVGGIAGQILRKTGPGNFETEWVDPNAVESVAVSELTDVVLTDLADTQILTYNSSSSRWVNTSIDSLPISASNISGTIDGGEASTF
jgi:hypothetical protein